MELILNTFGVCLNRDNEAFVVTHKDGRQRIPVEGIDSIQIAKGIQVTSDAILLALEHEIEILFTEKSGHPVGRVWSPRYGSISTIRKGQLNFTFSHDALPWIKGVLRDKMENQQAMILMMHTEDAELQRQVNKAISRIEDYRTKVQSIEGEIVADVAPQLRGWEGMASRIYFETLNLFIPDHYRFNVRTQHLARQCC